jgi:hypothetical protein
VKPDRLRATGWLVLAIGLLAASAVYWIEAHGADAALNDTTALGYRRSLNHEMGVMMGRLGLILTDWSEWLASPIGHAAMVLAAAVVVAAICFRLAWVHDEQE